MTRKRKVNPEEAAQDNARDQITNDVLERLGITRNDPRHRRAFAVLRPEIQNLFDGSTTAHRAERGSLTVQYTPPEYRLHQVLRLSPQVKLIAGCGLGNLARTARRNQELQAILKGGNR